MGSQRDHPLIERALYFKTQAAPAKDVTGDLSKDGSVLKQILKASTSTLQPEKGDRCLVHVVGTLEDGTQFEDRDREIDIASEAPGNYKAPTGVVLGLGTMRKNEEALFTIQPQMGYGAEGLKTADSDDEQFTVPPNSVITVRLTLKAWLQHGVKDISLQGEEMSGKILKKIITKGRIPPGGMFHPTPGGTGKLVPPGEKGEPLADVSVHVIGRILVTKTCSICVVLVRCCADSLFLLFSRRAPRKI
jgi:hypothetical protein